MPSYWERCGSPATNTKSKSLLSSGMRLYWSGYIRNNHYKSIVQLTSGNFPRQLNLEKHTDGDKNKKRI